MNVIIRKIITKIRGEADIEMLKHDGLKIGKNFSYGKGCFFDPSICFLIEIGNNVTFSSKVHLLAHDASTKKMLGYSKVAPVRIGDNVFIGANVTVLPGVKIGNGSIIGAGSVVTKSIPENQVWGGNPAKFISTTENYYAKVSKKNAKRFNAMYKIGCGITEEMKLEMKRELERSSILWVD